jgi:folate-binding Fe-S cluster repair protein YgfZ
MKHRGEARKRVVRVRLAGAAPAPGTPVTDGAFTVGALGAAAGDKALALLRIDRVAAAQAAGRPLEAAGVPLTVEEAPAAS